MPEFRLGKYLIQKIKRAYYVSVPKLWVESRRLQKGSVLEAFLDDQGDLVFRVAGGTSNGD